MSEVLKPKDISENECVTINQIWHERNRFVRKYGSYPEYIMIHPINKSYLNKEAVNSTCFEHRYEGVCCFDILIVWTSLIPAQKVICTRS